MTRPFSQNLTPLFLINIQGPRVRRQTQRLGGESRGAGQEENLYHLVGLPHQWQKQVWINAFIIGLTC